MKKRTILLLLLLSLVAAFSACGRRAKLLDPSSLRGMSLEQLQTMREQIQSRHADGSSLSAVEAANVAVLRAQERRLENAWIFGEWRERHGARLIFRDDGTVNVGARAGAYDELGIYKYLPAEQPSYESLWELIYDESGDPLVLVGTDDGYLVYPFHGSRSEVYECSGDLLEVTPTGCYFVKINH